MMDDELRTTDREPEARPWQFSLKAMMTAVSLVALACGAAARVALTWNGFARNGVDILALYSLPVLVCAAIGVLHGRLKRWMFISFMLDILIVVRLIYLHLFLMR
jgi:hypothetical protein